MDTKSSPDQSSTLVIGSHTIGPENPCYVIAEAGLNHNGDPEMAARLIETAAQCGASAVKFQTYRTEELFPPDHPDYRKFKQMEFSLETYHELKQVADSNHIEFLSTPFDEECADLLDEVGVRAFKVGSGELTHLSFLKSLGTRHKPVLLSTGMSTYNQIEAALNAIRSTDSPPPTALLHCVSSYPCPVEEANLRCIPALNNRYSVPVGYSDHTESHTAPMAAFSMGACIIEKHFTLSRHLPGWDHHFSYDPDEMADLIESIRTLETALGSAEKLVTGNEASTEQIARRAIYVRKPIHEGEMISRDALVIRRPSGPMSADRIDDVVGKVAARNLGVDDALSEEDLRST